MNAKQISIVGIIVGILLVLIGAVLKIQKEEQTSLLLTVGIIVEIVAVVSLALSSKRA